MNNRIRYLGNETPKTPLQGLPACCQCHDQHPQLQVNDGLLTLSGQHFLTKILVFDNFDIIESMLGAQFYTLYLNDRVARGQL